jgi:type IV pilus assembly protein PilW
MKPSNKPSPFHQAGFTLVEIMVGLAIGMLATMVIMQVMSVFETQKRVTTGTADAQTNGGIALYNIGRELQLAGYPLLPLEDSPLECTALTFGATGIGGISPVSITEGVAAPGVSASDTITIRYGSSQMGGVPTRITAMGAPTANDATVDNNLGCQANDIAIIINGAACAMTGVSAVPGASTITLKDNTAVAAGVAIANANIACLGAWNEVTYAVNAGNLTRNGVPSVAGIVNLQAQYGVSATANSNQVAQWVNASGGTWAAPAIADRNRIKAVRIAVVARNPKMESTAVTAACSSLTAAAPTGLCAWAGSATSPAPTIDLSAGDTNWLRYRYRVFETIIPLRNVIWSKDTL